MEHSFFYLLPHPEHVLQSDMQLVMTNMLLMKLGGQLEITAADLKMLAHDYSGYRITYSAKKEAWTLTLKVRTDEYPEPEPTHK